jgi:hypothetical protein
MRISIFATDFFDPPSCHRSAMSDGSSWVTTDISRTPPSESAAITLVGHVYSGPVAGVWSAMLEAAARDSDVAGWCDLHEQRRHETLVRVLEMCGAARPAPPVLDAMWAVGSMEVFAKLTRQRGGTVQQWVGWIVDTFRTLVSRPIRLVTGPTPNILAEVTRQ